MVLLSGPNMGGNVWKYVKDCLDTGWVSSVGAYVDQFEKMTADYTGAKYAVATSSGTTALHIALLLAGVGQDDYVITNNVTFVATCNSIRYVGAQPILMDADKDNWQLDLDLLEQFLQEETAIKDGKCIYKKDGRTIPVLMPVHVLGNICNMDRLMAICRKHHLLLIEDSTEALGSFYKNKHAGTFGIMGTLSYNGNKIITTGGGGMILTDDETLAKKAKHLTTQAKSDAFEYMHDEIGYNYRLVNVAAAMGVSQMELLPDFISRKKEIISFYKNELENTGDITFQKVHDDVNPNWWMPTIASVKQRALLQKLNEAKLQSRPFWIPMNQLPMFRENIYYNHHDRSGQLYQQCLSIPCSTNISAESLEAVVRVVKSCF